jgi:RNase P/RNase MRP subunit p29
MRKLQPLGPFLMATLLASPASAEPSFVGIWYSGNQPDEPGVLSLIEFREDGTFREEFRKCENGNVVGFQTESGTWTVNDGIERLTVDMLNGEKVQIDGVYTVTLLTDTERRVRMEPEGLVFVSHRVTKFEFPDCPSGV